MPDQDENDINPIRLKTFLEVIRESGVNITDALDRHMAEFAAEIRGASHNKWLSHRREPKLIAALCEEYTSWHLLLKTGQECLRSAMLHLMPYLPDRTVLSDVAYRIPSSVAIFLTHLNIRVIETEPTCRYEILIEPRRNAELSPVDILFIQGVLLGLYRFFNASGIQIELVSLPAILGAVPQNSGLSGVPLGNQCLLDLRLPTKDDTTSQQQQTTIDTHDAFVADVLKRAAELLQDKRELMTAVEYLHRANEELEKEIRANKKELRMARNIQKGFVPPRIPDWKGLQFWVKFFPLTEVSGDFYDYFSIGSNKIGLMVADVSGHGVPAALISAIAKLSFSNHRLDSPSEVFSKVNLDLLRYVKREGYLTSFYMIASSDYEITYSIAAAPAPLLFRARTGEVEKLPGSGTLLGMFPDANEMFLDQRTHLEPGDKLFIYTDGLIEAENTAGEAWGEERLMQAIRQFGYEPIQVVSEKVMDAYRSFILGSGSRDDVTLITVSLSERVQEFEELVFKARTAWNNKEKQKACSLLREAIAIFPRHTNTLFLLGKYLALNAEYNDAAEYLQQYILLKPYNADAYTLTAYCSFHLGNYEKALDELKRSLSLRSENPSALYNMVRVYLALNRQEDARTTLSALEFLRPNNDKVKALKKKYFPD